MPYLATIMSEYKIEGAEKKTELCIIEINKRGPQVNIGALMLCLGKCITLLPYVRISLGQDKNKWGNEASC